jgi:hypothetical protein
MGNRVILDNADAGTVVDSYLNSKVCLVWVRSGEAEILHDTDVIVSLLPGERKVIDGGGIAFAVQGKSLVDGTTLMFSDG